MAKGRLRAIVLNSLVREGHFETTFEQRLKEKEPALKT